VLARGSGLNGSGNFFLLSAQVSFGRASEGGKGEKAMSHLTFAYDWTARELPGREPWTADDDADSLVLLDGGYIPAPASRFNIQNVEQWIDLCA
jgi:hypothetical protein